MKLGSIRFPDLVQFKVTDSRGVFRRELFVERYVDGKLIGASWVGNRDTVTVTVTLEVDK